MGATWRRRVFIDLVELSQDAIKEKKEKAMRQLALDADYTGFSFAPSDFMKEYLDEKNKDPKSEQAIAAASKLFCHMTNFVAQHHGWHTGGDLAPSPYLDVEMDIDQIDLLNPTPRDVQMAAIIDQCSGKKARKVIAKRRIEFISGNVNSYARILSGPQQLERIKTFNDLSASIAVLQREKQAEAEKSRKEKKNKEVEKAANKVEKDRVAKEEHAKLSPGCKADVEKGIDWVLLCNNTRRKEILKIHFGYSSGLSKLKMADTERELRKYMGPTLEQNETGNTSGESNDVALISLPPLLLVPIPEPASYQNETLDNNYNGEEAC